MGRCVAPLEPRVLLAAVSESGDQLNIDLQQDESLSISTDGNAYTFHSNVNMTDGGVTDSAVFTGFGSMSLTLDDLTKYTSIQITDSGTNAAVTFEDSGANVYQHDFQIALVDEVAQIRAVGFRGTSNFGSAQLVVQADRTIALHSGSQLTTVDGDISLTAVNVATTGVSRGITMVEATITTSGSGNIMLDGTAANVADQDFQLGISMQSESAIHSTSAAVDAGTIALKGTGGIGNQFSIGVVLSTLSMISSVSGDIQITGTGGSGAGEGHRGVRMSTTSQIHSTGTDSNAAKITIEGVGGNGTDRNYGVQISEESDIRSIAGDINVTGTGGSGTGFNNSGLGISDTTIASSGTGALAAQITLNGTAGAGTNSVRGVVVNNTTVSSVDGNILFQGFGGTATGNSNRGIEINNGSQIESTGTTSDAATITFEGQATSGTEFNDGIWLTNMTLTSVVGDVAISGVGADASGHTNNAVSLTDAVISSTGVGDLAAKITVHGTAGTGTAFNSGIQMRRSTIGSVDGDILMTGRAAVATGDSNGGVRVVDDSVIESTGTGSSAATITIDGQSVSGTNFSDGVVIAEGSVLRSVDGDVDVTGVGANNSNFNNGGVALFKGSVISTGTGPDAATITLNGTGGTGVNLNRGIEVNQSTISSVDGNIDVTGVGNGSGNDNRGIGVLDNSTIESTGSTSTAAAIRLAGSGGAGIGHNYGVFVSESRISTIVGGVDMQGTGGHGTGNSNYGVSIQENSILESTGSDPSNAQIFVKGTGGDAVDWGVGVAVSTGTTIRSVTSDISLNGDGGNGTGDSNRGINMVGFGVIESTGAGADAAKIFITGNGGGGVTSNIGVFSFGEDPIVRTVDGDVQVNGQTSLLPSGELNTGVWWATDLVSTGTARLTVIGRGEDGTDVGRNRGITIGSVGTEIRSADGDISFHGVGGGTGDENGGHTGICLLPGTSIVSTNTAAIILSGDGGAADSHGVWLRDADESGSAAFIRSEGSGPIVITGTGPGDNLRLDGAASIDATAASPVIQVDAATIRVSSRETLGGESGVAITSDAVTYSGLIDPGGPGGVTTFAGSAIIDEESTLVIDTHGTGATDPQFNDSIRTNGQFDIRDSAELHVRWNSAWQAIPDDVLTIVERTGGSGTFAGLPEGAAVADFFNATISYVGGDGDDITLTIPSVLSDAHSTRTIVLQPGSLGITIWGSDDDDNAGQSVHDAGDVNGDGYDDFLVAASKADSIDNARANAGEVYLIYGGPNLPTTIDTRNLGDAGVTIYGGAAADQTGHFVGTADLDDDGFSDIVIGAHLRNDSPVPGESEGGAYVILGADDLHSTIDLRIPGAADSTLRGFDAEDLTGNAISGIGDLNRDGYEDFAFGAIRADSVNNERDSAGDVHIVFGDDHIPTVIDFSRSSDRTMTIFGAAAGDELGVGIRPLGDVNGDGGDDVIITSWKASGTGENTNAAGRSYILYGSRSLGDDIDLAAPGAVDVTIFGIDSGDLSGWGVSSGGDVNGDGLNDFLIGASQADGPNNDQPNRGESYLIPGSRSLPAIIDLADANSGAIMIYGADEGDFSGRSIDIVGDLNADGFDDIAIGARGADGLDGTLPSAGETSIVLGRSNWPRTLDLSVPGAAAVTLYGADAGDNSGFMVRAAGDVDDDFLPDLIIGDRFADSLDNLRPGAGQAHIVTNRAVFNPHTKPTILAPLRTSPFLPLSYRWSKVHDAVSYELWVNHIGGDNTPVQRRSTSETEIPVGTLPFGRYRMWVQGVRQDGTTTDWAIETFTANAATVIHDRPADASNSRPSIQWNAVAGAVGYQVYISNVTSQESGVFDVDVTTNEFTTPTHLDFGRHRVWVRPIAADGFRGQWSASVIIDNIPQPSSPVGATTNTGHPAFSWLGFAASYRLLIVGPGGFLIDETGLTSPTFLTNRTFPAGDYRWWVQGFTEDGKAGPWSDLAEYTTGGRTHINTPVVRELGIIPKFEWPVVHNGEYEIYISKAGTPGAYHRKSGLGVPRYNGPALDNGEYKVWIRTTVGRDTRVWGKGVAFTIDDLSAEITAAPRSPVGGRFLSNTIFSWQDAAGARGYDVYALNTDPAVEPVTLVNVQGPSSPPQQLAAGEWTWWVRARDASGAPGPWSSATTFNTDGRVDSPNVTAPNSATPPVFTWSVVAGAVRYVLQVDNLTTGETNFVRENELTATTFTAASAFPAGSYRSWVRAISGDGVFGAWSRQTDFVVG